MSYINIVGPFPGKRFKVQTTAMNRSRPSISVNFNIPFSGLCHGMQVMHRSGFSVTDLNTGYVKSDTEDQLPISKDNLTPENTKTSSSKIRDPKNIKTKAENKDEGVKKTDKKSGQRNRRQRRK